MRGSTWAGPRSERKALLEAVEEGVQSVLTNPAESEQAK